MAIVNPVPKEQAPPALIPIYEALIGKFGRMPNIFGVMAHRPDALQGFLAFYSGVMEHGTLEARYQELAYLKTSLINGCAY